MKKLTKSLLFSYSQQEGGNALVDAYGFEAAAVDNTRVDDPLGGKTWEEIQAEKEELERKNAESQARQDCIGHMGIEATKGSASGAIGAIIVSYWAAPVTPAIVAGTAIGGGAVAAVNATDDKECSSGWPWQD